MFQKLIYFQILFLCAFILSTKNSSCLELYNFLGYNFPGNESYVDTVNDEDIYWNPNSGFNLTLGLVQRFANHLQFGLAGSATLGYYKYPTTDGRKVNTETQAKNVPPTVNVEWSRIYSLVPFIGSYYALGPVTFQFGVGAGPYFARTYESWEFTNVNGQKARLEIKKYYPVTLGFVGKLGMDIRLSKSLSLVLEGQFEAVNLTMSQVDLTSYTLDGVETIKKYNRNQRTYIYARDVPDENKGGGALLAGFNFANYPQEKIAMALGIRVGVAYRF